MWGRVHDEQPYGRWRSEFKSSCLTGEHEHRLYDQLDSGEDLSEDNIVTQKRRAPSMSLKRYFPSASNADQTAQKKAKQSHGPLSFFIGGHQLT